MDTTVVRQRSNTKAQPWIEWTNLSLGAFLAASPWLGLGGGAAVMWNALSCGLIILAAACFALSKPSVGAEWTNVGVGLWLLIAPWVLGFASITGAMWTSVLVGLAVASLAGVQLSLLNRSRGA